MPMPFAATSSVILLPKSIPSTVSGVVAEVDNEECALEFCQTCLWCQGLGFCKSSMLKTTRFGCMELNQAMKFGRKLLWEIRPVPGL